MRSVTLLVTSVLVAAPLVTLGTPARAANNDVLEQAQRFMNNDNSKNDNRDAYERGRDDEMRRQQAQQENTRSRRDDYRGPRYGYDSGER